MTQIERPIIVIGAPRSGTTFLAQLLEALPGAAVWVEPKYVWRYGNARAEHDLRVADEATPKIQKYISARFAEFLQKQDASVYVDKTPSNCFRIPFIERVFPDAIYLHILRDGRAVTISAAREWSARKESGVFLRRLRNRDIPWGELINYIPQILKELIRRQLFPSATHIWGARFPGIEQYRQSHGLYETCAMQWRQCVEHSLQALAEIPAERVLSVTYEDLCGDPQGFLDALCRLRELEPVRELRAQPRSTSTAVICPTVVSESERRAVEEILAPVQRRLGYPLRFDDQPDH